MKRLVFLITTLFTLTEIAFAQFASAPAFPGAEGYGRYVTGGHGTTGTPTIYHVTNLKDSGSGSLRYGVESKSGYRIIVFDVAGTIALSSQLNIKNGNVTILGQTAPGDGICIKNYGVQIKASNVILRFLRFRMGDEKGVEADALGFMSHNESPAFKNIVIDHCSISWSTDECASFYGVENFSFQWNYVTESLKISVHDKGSHGYGGIWGGKKASYHHNLIAHHDSRNPRLDHGYVSTIGGPLDLINNVIYNWGGNTCYGGENKSGYAAKTYNILNNYYKPGPATKSSVATRMLDPTISCSNCGSGCVPGIFYMTGNYMYGSPTVTADNWKGSTHNTASLKSFVRFTSGEELYDTCKLLNMHKAETAFEKVTNCAGASFKRDVIDERIAEEAREGTYTFDGSMGSTGGLIDSQSDVGGWPIYGSDSKPKDTDKDGIPDDWEEANGLNPASATDAAKRTLDPRGYYTNIEVYANWLVESIIKEEMADAEEGFEEYYPEVVDPNAPKGLKGDANNDSVVDVADITAIASYILGTTPEAWNQTNADANSDDTIDVADITATAGIILGE